MDDTTLFFRRRKSHTKNTTINVAPMDRLHAIPDISPALRPLCLDSEFEEEFEEEVGVVDALFGNELGNGTTVVVVAALVVVRKGGGGIHRVCGFLGRACSCCHRINWQKYTEYHTSV